MPQIDMKPKVGWTEVRRPSAEWLDGAPERFAASGGFADRQVGKTPYSVRSTSTTL